MGSGSLKIVVLSASLLLGPSQFAQAASRADSNRILASDMKPSWGGRKQITPNQSYLADQAKNLNIEAINQMQVLGNRQVLELRQQYQDLNRDYEMRRLYGLVDTKAETSHTDQMNGFSRTVIGQVRQNQVKQYGEKLVHASQQNEALRTVAKPAAVAGTIVAVSSGMPVGIKLSDSSKLTTMTNVADRNGQIHLESPLMDARVEMRAAAPSVWDPTQPGERFQLSLSRPLDFWDLRSGVTYGSSSTSLSASLVKPLSEHLTAVLDSIHPLSSDIALSPEQRLTLLYGVRF